MTKLTIVAVLLAVGSAGRGLRSSDEAADAVKAFESRWTTALQRADIPALESILTEDFSDTDESGGRTDRAGVLSALKSGDLKLRSIVLGPMIVHVYGDAAVVIGSADQKGAYKGQPLAAKVIFTDTCVRQGGEWRAVASHRSLPAAH